MFQRDIFPTIKKYLLDKENIIITGMRRVGKTTLLNQLFDGLTSTNKLFLDLENPLNRKYFDEINYDEIYTTLVGLGIQPKKRAFIFLDEIQYSPDIPSVVKYLSDHYSCKFILTGSASFYLKNLFTESLAGRKKLFELFPLSFQEYLRFREKDIQISNNLLTESLYYRIQKLYKEYVEFGAFPQVVLERNHKKKIEALEEIFTTYFHKEVLELRDFRKNQVIRDLILLLMERVGSRVEIRKLASELGITRITLQEYLAFLEGTYLFTFISPFSRNRDVEIRSSKKVYCIDSGLSYHIGRASRGAVFENAIFHQLRLKAKKIQYYQKKSGVEIDFIVNQSKALEVKMTATLSDYKRMKQLQKELKFKKSLLISYQFAPNLTLRYGFQI